MGGGIRWLINLATLLAIIGGLFINLINQFMCVFMAHGYKNRFEIQNRDYLNTLIVNDQHLYRIVIGTETRPFSCCDIANWC